MTLYLVLEGGDGCGKSEQARRLIEALDARGLDPLHLREPGSTPVGETLRALLLDPNSAELSPRAEALLFFAARAEMIDQQVVPALRAGRVVVSERCFLSTMVYQGRAPTTGAVSDDRLRAWTQAAHETHLGGESRLVMPDAIFVLDVPYDVAVTRRSGRAGGDDRIEARAAAFHQRVATAYADLAASVDGAQLVDAQGSVIDVAAELWQRVEKMLDQRSNHAGSRP